MSDAYYELAPKISVNEKKRDLVLFDNDFAVDKEELARLFPGIDFVTLEGFTREEMMREYAQAKVLVDLYVPGAERDLYEASLFNTLVVVGNNGNARDDIDVPVPVKVDVDIPTAELGELLHELLENYEEEVPRWQALRDLTERSPSLFLEQVDQYVDCAHEPPP